MNQVINTRSKPTWTQLIQEPLRLNSRDLRLQHTKYLRPKRSFYIQIIHKHSHKFLLGGSYIQLPGVILAMIIFKIITPNTGGLCPT